MNKNPTQYFSVRQLSERWSCSINHIRRLLDDGKLPRLKVDNWLVRIPADAVIEYEGKHTHTGRKPKLKAIETRKQQKTA